MAISATRLHSEFRRRVNRADSSDNNNFDVPIIDMYLNEAQDIYYNNRLSILETNPQVRDDLRKAEVKQYCTQCKISKEDNRVCVVKLPDNFYRRLRQSAFVNCEDKRNCDEKEIILRVAQEDDLGEILKDPHRKPSFEFEEAWIDEGSEGLYLYHNNAFKVKKVCISYYKKLPRIAAPSLLKPSGEYINGDGEKVNKDQGYILDTTDSWRKVVDIASLSALRDIKDNQNYQTELSKILQTEKLHVQ